MNINKRIKEVRQHFGLNQTDFGNRIGLSRDAIANIEGERVTVKDLNISMICREYDVNEQWLRTGEGNPYIEMSVEDQLYDFMGKIASEDPSSYKRRFVQMLAQLDVSDWDVLQKMMETMLKNPGE